MAPSQNGRGRPLPLQLLPPKYGVFNQYVFFSPLPRFLIWSEKKKKRKKGKEEKPKSRGASKDGDWRVFSGNPPCSWFFRTDPHGGGPVVQTPPQWGLKGGGPTTPSASPARSPLREGGGLINQHGAASPRPPADAIITASFHPRSSAAPDLRPAASMVCNYKLIAEMNFLLAPSSSTSPPFPPPAPPPRG